MKSREIICTTILSVLVYFALSPQTRATCGSPDPGCPGGNLAEGYLALAGLTAGAYNTGIGTFSLLSLTDGNFCTGVGAGALLSNTGSENTATGAGALLSNTIATQNTANGAFALFTNSQGSNNVAVGSHALFSNTIGSSNTATGAAGLLSNTTGDFNTAVGFAALASNTNGFQNSALGYLALDGNTTGIANTAIGYAALATATAANNTAVGNQALAQNTTGSENTALGSLAGFNIVTASNVICIGAGVEGSDVSGTTWIANVYGATTQSFTTAPVIVSDGGQLGTVVSSERFKKDIAAMEKASEAILALKPVTFHYKADTKGVPQFGLIAEEVAKVNPALVLPDKEGKPYTVRYDAVNAMLLNEFLKEHKKTEKLEATVVSLIATVKEQAAQIQKVSAQLEASKPAPQVVNNP